MRLDATRGSVMGSWHIWSNMIHMELKGTRATLKIGLMHYQVWVMKTNEIRLH